MTALSLALGFLGLLGFAGYVLTLRERRPKAVSAAVLECTVAAESAKRVAEEAKAVAARAGKETSDLALAVGFTRRQPQVQPEELKD